MHDLDAAEDWLRTWTAEASARAAAAQALSDQVAATTVSATDATGLVTVSVDGTGALVKLRLDRDAGHGDMERLAEQILGTMRRAQAALAHQVSVMVDHTVGSDSETGRMVVAGFDRRFARDPDHGK